MAKNNANLKQPKSVIGHEVAVADYLSTQMGVSDFQLAYNHFFLRAGHMHSLIQRVNQFIKDGLLDDGRPEFMQKEEDYKLDQVSIDRMNYIWFDGVYLVVTRDPRNTNIVTKRQRFSTEPKNLAYNQEVMKFPALKSMNPRALVGAEDFIRIGSTMFNKDVFSGYDYKYIVTAGKFYITTSKGKEPLFESNEDMLNPRRKTSMIPHAKFQYILDVEIPLWEKYENRVYSGLHKIYQDLKAGGMIEDDDDISSTATPMSNKGDI